MTGRYTVVYEGDPDGIKILSGEPAPGRAITVIVGDQWEEVATLRAERDQLASELREAREALKVAQSALAMLTEPKEIRSTSVANAWAIAVDAELKCRRALSDPRPSPAKGDDHGA